MVDETENLTLKLLQGVRADIAALSRGIDERFEKLGAEIARVQADVSRMQADVSETKAISREIAVRLTLLEKRISAVEPA